jgi:FkbM family methyltransferase
VRSARRDGLRHTLARFAAKRAGSIDGGVIGEALAMEREWRESFFDLASRTSPYVAVSTDRLTFIVNTHDVNIGRKLFVSGSRKEMRVLAGVVDILDDVGQHVAGTVFVDVGANIGTTCLTAVRLHGFASAVACEPDKENFRTLRANIVINGLDTAVTAVEVSVSDRVGRADLRVNVGKSGLHMLTGPRRGLRRSVKVTTIDRLVKREVIDPRQVGLLWMDIQGHEGHALAGASSLVDRGVPVVFELSPDHLEYSGGTQMLVDAIAQNYTHIVDLGELRSGPRPRFMSAASTGSLLERHADHFTDVLACRLPSGTAT